MALVTTSLRLLRPLLERVIVAIEPRHTAGSEERRWTPNKSGSPEPPAFTRRFRLEFSPRGFTEGGEWGAGTTDTSVELAVITDYVGTPDLIAEVAEDDWQDLRHAINTAKNPDVGIIAIQYEGSPFEDTGEDGRKVQIAHTFLLRYRAAY